MANDYEKLRQQNIADNKRILAELGLLNPFEPLPRVIKKAPKRKRQPDVPKPEKRVVERKEDEDAAESLETYGSTMEGSRRRSSRLTGKAPLSESEIAEQAKSWGNEEGEEDTPNRKSAIRRPMAYGAIPGVEVGTVWPMRIDCNAAGIHRPTVAGIHGGPQGAYSIVLSGGYEDNIDLGTCFTYTGEGGRDLKGTAAKPKNLRTAPQSKDQCLSRGNAALVKSVETEFPVRVVRGFKLTSPFAPEEGYRYDGLYKVEKWWYTVGIAGYGVYKFALKRLEDQAPPPWTFEGEEDTIGGTQDSGVGSEVTSDCGSDTEQETVPKKKKTSKEADKSKTKDGEDDVKRDAKISETDIGSNNKQDASSGDESSSNKKEGKEKSKGKESKENIEAKGNSEQEMETENDGKQEVKRGSGEEQEMETENDGKQEVNKGNDGKQEVERKDDGKQEVNKDGDGKQEVNKEDGGKQEVETGDDKENLEGSPTPSEKKSRNKSGRRLSGKGGKLGGENTQKNTMLKYFNKA